MNIITRQQAINDNLPRYFTGKPCRNGHVAERYRVGGTCVECDRERHLEQAMPTEGGFNHRVFILGAPKCSKSNSSNATS